MISSAMPISFAGVYMMAGFTIERSAYFIKDVLAALLEYKDRSLYSSPSDHLSPSLLSDIHCKRIGLLLGLLKSRRRELDTSRQECKLWPEQRECRQIYLRYLAEIFSVSCPSGIGGPLPEAALFDFATHCIDEIPTN